MVLYINLYGCLNKLGQYGKSVDLGFDHELYIDSYQICIYSVSEI